MRIQKPQTSLRIQRAMGAESGVGSSSSITAFPTKDAVAIVGVLNNYSGPKLESALGSRTKAVRKLQCLSSASSAPVHDLELRIAHASCALYQRTLIRSFKNRTNRVHSL